MNNITLIPLKTKIIVRNDDISQIILELLRKKQVELESAQKDIETPGGAWKEKLKIYDEIDKSLEIVDDNLKTKKLKEDTEES